MAVTELCWLRSDPPDECRGFFDREYPAIALCGYETIGHFTLPELSWWKPYYHPLETRLRSFRERCATEAEKLAVVELLQTEIETYRKFSDFYGYVFYMMRRP